MIASKLSLFCPPPPRDRRGFTRARSFRKAAALALTVAIALAAALFDSPKTAYADNPAPSAIAMQSAAGTDKMYATGDAITVRVTFPKTIQSAMGAMLNIQIGENTRAATASDCTNCGTTYLDFSYTVAAGDYDANGVTVATDALSATALTHSHAGTPHAFTLTLPNTLARPQGNHRVNLGDYDQDDDGLIEVSTLDHLNAIRWDLDGDGGVSSGNSTNYTNAFLNRSATMGCPTNSQDADNNDCMGYELAENLDFDTDGDGDVDSNDDYSNWTPIGGAINFSSKLKGNNKTISNLTITNTSDYANVGLFASLPGSVIGVGLVDVNITSSAQSIFVGAIAGRHLGTIRSSYSTGDISATGIGLPYAGGLAGYFASGTIASSWSEANVSISNSSTNNARVGGLWGASIAGTSAIATYAAGAVSGNGSAIAVGGLAGVTGSTISASYAIGPVSATGTGAVKGGLYGSASSGATTTASYWDVGTTGIADDSDTNMPEGKTTSELQSITGYDTGSVYADWNVNVDGQTGNDDPWDFGTWMQYPMLKFGGMSVVAQGSLAMGMPSSNGNHPVVGENAQVCLVNGRPSIRASGTRNGKAPWVWQRSTDGKTWSDITEDGGPTWRYTPVSGDVGNHLRACVPLGDNAPEGADEACVRMFAKAKAAGG